MSTESQHKPFEVVWRVLLAIAGFNVALFWLGLGLLPMIDIWGTSVINLDRISWMETLGGLVLFVWTLLGVIKPTPLRVIPPALISFPIALIGLFQIVQGYVNRFIQT